MKALLMHPDRDFEPAPKSPPEEAGGYHARYGEVRPEPPTGHAANLWQDLALDTLAGAMAAEDPFLFEVARKALLAAPGNDLATIGHRQDILRDCLAQPATLREIYGLAVAAIESRKARFFGVFSRYPSGILHGAGDLMAHLAGFLAKLRDIAETQSGRFTSRGLTNLFTTIRNECGEDYLAAIAAHLARLRFDHGVLLSAGLGEGNAGTGYVLREPRADEPGWFDRVLHRGPPAYTFRLHERDEQGGMILSQLRDQGINEVANALAQATDHLLSFFHMLRTELAFYVGAANLAERLGALGIAIAFPEPEAAGTGRLSCRELRDPCLALTMGGGVVGNGVEADAKRLVVITGANQGGKSSFLRAVGLAQLMTQCGLFVAAEAYAAELVTDLFTHYKREEDAALASGKFDEELSRMNVIIDAVTPGAMVLFNESFASTNEREGSEIARQIVCALVEKGVKVLFVTHLYEFAHDLHGQGRADTLFLRADRQADGTRSFKLIRGQPLATSYGADLYRTVFISGQQAGDPGGRSGQGSGGGAAGAERRHGGLNLGSGSRMNGG